MRANNILYSIFAILFFNYTTISFDCIIKEKVPKQNRLDDSIMLQPLTHYLIVRRAISEEQKIGGTKHTRTVLRWERLLPIYSIFQ